MTKKIIAFTFIFALMTITLPAGAHINFSDVSDTYWAKENIDYVSSKGYMIGYGDRFGINDNITEGQYVAVLCRIFGYENQSPLTCEEPARALGLLKDNETINITENLKRGDLAKYTIRAFEMLNPNVTYPEYLEAYKGIITDYNTLDYDLKTIALKCVEKGLLAGNADGSFAPDSYSTRAQAAAFIHRLFSQAERNKVMPVFATPDPEFEAFMNDRREAEKFCSIFNIAYVDKGKIVWDTYDNEVGITILPTWYNKNANKEAYEVLKLLVGYARQNKNYVYSFYSLSSQSAAKFSYLTNYNTGTKSPSSFSFSFEIPVKTCFVNDNQTKNTNYYWLIRDVGYSENEEFDIEKLKKKMWQIDEFKIPLNSLFKLVHGNELGDYLFKYTMQEYEIEHIKAWNKQIYENYNITTVPQFGIEIQNYNDIGIVVTFGIGKLS